MPISRLTARSTILPTTILKRQPRSIIQPISNQLRHQGQKASPNPTVASSPEHKGNVDSRANDSTSSAGGSIAKPVTSNDKTGNSEEGQDPAKSDPNASTEEKRKNVLEQGNKPLDAADK